MPGPHHGEAAAAGRSPASLRARLLARRGRCGGPGGAGCAAGGAPEPALSRRRLRLGSAAAARAPLCRCQPALPAADITARRRSDSEDANGRAEGGSPSRSRPAFSSRRIPRKRRRGRFVASAGGGPSRRRRPPPRGTGPEGPAVLPGGRLPAFPRSGSGRTGLRPRQRGRSGAQRGQPGAVGQPCSGGSPLPLSLGSPPTQAPRRRWGKMRDPPRALRAGPGCESARGGGRRPRLHAPPAEPLRGRAGGAG